MEQRALLTKREREVLHGTNIEEISNVEAYRQKIRTRVRKRIKNLETDITILDEKERELAEDARRAACGPEPMLEQLREEIRQLRSELIDETGKV
ncbi:hypothetical protein ACFQMA_11750 [Halosimplex aquaticum]|uniref:Uncharacterized protein n=1 Tax=Halosimplex aquaticum TaxID=3026162 RepID=A0ABD5Y561_9EURY|nr:hypothetical protein [Halosimplex aquaticum]